MIILLDTSASICRLTLVPRGGGKWIEYEWEAGRLARELLGWLAARLEEQGAGIRDVTGIGVMRGPGSFTGLRIGLTVANTLADALAVPVAGSTGDGWRRAAVERLKRGESEGAVLPLYASGAHISTPRK